MSDSQPLYLLSQTKGVIKVLQTIESLLQTDSDNDEAISHNCSKKSHEVEIQLDIIKAKKHRRITHFF